MLTVAIPFFNAEQYLELAIKSVINQSYQNWVLLLMDDGSSDNSLDIATKYEQMDSRIKVYSDGKNKNLAVRLNKIATLTQTKYLARMDADDVMHPNRLEIQLKILEANPEIDLLGTNAYTINQHNVVTGIRKPLINNSNTIISTESFIHPTIMGKTNWFKNNLYNPRAERIEDAELWWRTKKSSVFKSINEPLLFYREFGGNYFPKYKKASNTLIKLSFEKGFNFLLFKKATDRYIKFLIYKILNKFNLENILIKRRNNLLTKKDVIFANQLMEKMQSCSDESNIKIN